MKTLSAALAAHIAGEVTTLATCWRIEHTDGWVRGSTDRDPTLATDGVFDLPKLASAVIAVSEAVAWDNTAKQVNAPAKAATRSASRSKPLEMVRRPCACGWTGSRRQWCNFA